MMYRPPGVFTRSNGERLFAFSNIHKLTGVPAHEITDAVIRGELTIELVNGCKCVRESELKRYSERRAANGE